jgi:phosphatidylinositol alpha-mannosyltransferase
VKIGLACPYTWDMPGGVQAHIHDLAEAFLGLGHQVSVITPVDDARNLPSYAVDAGRAFPLPYNGSVSRVLLGPLSAARVRRWLRDGDFDILHVHEPTAPSVSLLACMLADGPMVATFHTANPRSRFLSAAGPVLQPSFEKLSACIAVSEAARRTIVEHLGTTAVLIPNGVSVQDFATAEPLTRYGPVAEGEVGRTVAFLGRIDEPRKGLQVLLDALPQVIRQIPDVHVLVAGPGGTDEVLKDLPAEILDRVSLLGLVSIPDKPRVYRSADIYCAPNTGQESFGIVLLEAMAAGTPVLASDLDAFRRVLGDGTAGELFAAGDSAALADALVKLLRDPRRRAELAAEGERVVQVYDWPVIAQQVLHVYETVSVPRQPGPPSPATRFRRSPVRPIERSDGALDGLDVFGELPTLPPP